MRTLLSGIELDDKKPSQFLREIRSLAGENAKRLIDNLTQLNVPGHMEFSTTSKLKVLQLSADRDDIRQKTWAFVMALRKRIQQLRPQPTHHHGKRIAFRQRQLEQAIHVFIRKDGIRKPLQHPYTGPHPYFVVKKLSDVVYCTCKSNKHKNKVVHSDRLALYLER
ncbi:hypothetical protein ALC56_06683 [Trachymyrmex septentrionalis]|uniref:Integrase p58-like C-terminal domain-containing protein n=1 Tax=Trachymyrmex septentrionalis TaxID=34720 RepID=A0A151JWQ9_9HYME|nr:hypothetical protein ALC56_06683 [Trachymyrmex septentrionalis]